ncbi:MAG: DUF485 domain-containing protein [Sphingosinicella sp.]|nr:DUF485 domain-containing protein [Sphingosinicella sp.]
MPDQPKSADHKRQATALAADPRYEILVRKRSRFAWTLTVIMLLIFFGYILLIAFDKALLAQPLYQGATVSLGIPIGIGVILAGIILTGIYVRRANREYDPIMLSFREDAER